MKTIIQFVQMPTSESMEIYAKQKLQKIHHKYEWIIRANVSFKKESDPTGKGKVCTIELSVPGPKIYATSTKENYEHAFKETLNDIERQLKKRKANRTSNSFFV